MNTKVAKWGNSVGIRIPSDIANATGIKEGSIVELIVKESALIIKPQKNGLDSLLDKITPENLHQEVDFGTNVGKEVW